MEETGPVKLSILIPAHNEEDSIEGTVAEVQRGLEDEGIDYEIVVVNDNSTDSTPEILDRLSKDSETIVVVKRTPPSGFGLAVRDGLRAFTGDAVVIVMGDASDAVSDIVAYSRKLEEGFDCVFGSRFIKGSVVKDYPGVKYFINRLANTFIRCLFLLRHNDITNAFKAYKREVIEAILPIQARHFNITVELPLKAIVRGFNCATVPISWYGRESGVSKLGIREMGRKYFFTTLYVWLEWMLMKDEFKDKDSKKRRKSTGA